MLLLGFGVGLGLSRLLDCCRDVPTCLLIALDACLCIRMQLCGHVLTAYACMHGRTHMRASGI